MYKKKYDLIEVADIVENEGLGYAVVDYMSGDSIADPELAALWDQAAGLLNRIKEKLHLE